MGNNFILLLISITILGCKTSIDSNNPPTGHHSSSQKSNYDATVRMHHLFVVPSEDDKDDFEEQLKLHMLSVEKDLKVIKVFPDDDNSRVYLIKECGTLDETNSVGKELETKFFSHRYIVTSIQEIIYKDMLKEGKSAFEGLGKLQEGKSNISFANQAVHLFVVPTRNDAKGFEKELKRKVLSIDKALTVIKVFPDDSQSRVYLIKNCGDINQSASIGKDLERIFTSREYNVASVPDNMFQRMLEKGSSAFIGISK